MTFKRFVKLLLISGLIMSCQKSPNDEGNQEGDVEPSSRLIESGDIIVSNAGSDSVLLFNSEGRYKKTLYETLTSSGESLTGITYNQDTDEILISVDGSDRVMSINTETGAERVFIANTNLNGNLKGNTRLANGDLLFVESNNVERFSSTGLRITTGGWPKALQTTGSAIAGLPGGGFVLCSTGTDVLRTYDDSGLQLATASSGIAGTTDVISCDTDADGNIIAAFSGTTDTIRKYSPDLGTVIWSYSNPSVFTTPSSLSVKSDGSILVADSAWNYLFELNADGEFIKILEGNNVEIDDLLSTPAFIYVQK